MPISFAKLEAQAPQLVNLAKKAQFNISKHGLEGQQARVALCLDHSGSMRPVYASGQMQALAERVLALSTQLDDDGSVDLFLFDTDAVYAGAIELVDYSGSVDRLRGRRAFGQTNYAAAIAAVREHFAMSDAQSRYALPVYVLFLTDGAPSSRTAAERALRDAAQVPIFWKFLSIGEDIEFLQKLDDLTGRRIDNADYQPVRDLGLVKDQTLFDLLLVKYPEWLSAAAAAGMLEQ